ncbi:MAG: sugar phosphate isomerase/epimerase family protein [Christensenellales bacterium]
MKYAFNTVTFGGVKSWIPSYSLDETMRRLARIGYDAIELVCASPHAWPDYLSSEDVKKIGEWQREYGIKIHSLTPIPGGRGPGCNLATICKEELIWSRNYLKQLVNLANSWEAKTISYSPGWTSIGSTDKEAWEIALDSLVDIGKYALEKGVTLCLEPALTLSEVVDTAQNVLDLMSESGLPNVKAMFDLEHCFNFITDPADYARKFKDKLGNIQFCDRLRKAPGTGGFDFYPVMQALKDIIYDGYITIEVGFARDSNPTSIARKSLLYLREVEKKLI